MKSAPLALLLLAAAPPHSAAAKAPPADNCRGDRSFTALRTQLQQIVHRRDFAALMQIVAPDIVLGHDGTPSDRATFRRAFDEGRDPVLWKDLRSALRNGCWSGGGERVMSSPREFGTEAHFRKRNGRWMLTGFYNSEP